jgi:membrane protein YqaA with SNARE-associated domain
MFFRRLIEYAYETWEAHELLERWKTWPWHNTFLLLVSLSLFAVIAKTGLAHEIDQHFRSLSYIGVFIAGMLAVSAFTVAPAFALLYGFAGDLNPWLVVLVAASGSVMGDYLIFHWVKDRVFHELRPLLDHFRRSRVSALFRTPYFAWLIPIMGMVIIASPAPDELGLGLLGASHIKKWQFLLLSFVLNSIGIWLIVLAAGSF